VDGLRQLTVYANEVGTLQENLMILPVPNPTTVEFENVPGDFWVTCEESFTRMGSRGDGLGGDLDVVSHGAYDVILVKNPGDLWRIPASFATLNAEIREFLTREYPTGFGFLLCRLTAGIVSYEPFAYSHAMESDGRLFIPTRVGPGLVNRDHRIYTACTTTGAHASTTWMPSHLNRIRWAAMPAPFRLTPAARIHMRELHGHGRDADIRELVRTHRG
jgi:hypothetical protein